MSQRPHVPKFGNWEDDDCVPYTQYFEKARKGRAKAMNLNDPHDNPETFHTDVPPTYASPIKTSPYSEVTKPNDELHISREDNIHRLGGSPLHHDSVAYNRTSYLPHHVYGDQMTSGHYQVRGGMVSDGFDYRDNHSPLHPNYQMKVGPYSSSECLPGGSHAFTSNSTGTLRMTGLQDNRTIKKGSAVPKFGEWDESNPYTADGYSRIFNKVREEKQKEVKQTGSAEVPNVSGDETSATDHESSHQPSGCWCFRSLVRKVSNSS